MGSAASVNFYESLPIRALTTKYLLRRMRSSLHRAARMVLLDGLLELQWRCNRPLLIGTRACAKVVRNGGVELVIDVLKLLPNDNVIIRASFQLLLLLCRIDTAIGQLLEYDGHFVIHFLLRTHGNDEFVDVDGKQLLAAIYAKGIWVAVNLVRDVISEMCYCDNCRPLAETRKVSHHFVHTEAYQNQGHVLANVRLRAITDPGGYAEERKERDIDRVKVVTTCMGDYSDSPVVHEVGCDAFIAFAREGAARPYLTKQPDVIKAVGDALKNACQCFSLRSEVVWKALRAIGMLGCTDQVRTELVKQGFTELVVRMFETTDDHDVKQEALWALSELSKNESCVLRLEQGDGWRILYKLVHLIKKTEELTVPAQLTFLFTKEKYFELIERDKQAEAKGRAEEEAKRKAEKDKSESIRETVNKRSRPLFGTAETKYYKKGGERLNMEQDEGVLVEGRNRTDKNVQAPKSTMTTTRSSAIYESDQSKKGAIIPRRSLP